MQKNQQGQGNQANPGKNDQQSQSGQKDSQQGGQQGKLTPSGGSDQQNQSSGGQNQHGSNIKSDPGQAQSRSAQPAQQGGDQGHRGDKQR